MKQHTLNLLHLVSKDREIHFEKIEYVDYEEDYRHIVMRAYYYIKTPAGFLKEVGCKVFKTAEEGNQFYIWCKQQGFTKEKVFYCGD